MGPLPKAGEWVRLEVPIDKVGLQPGEDVEAVIEVGLWFYPEESPPAIETQGEQRFTAGHPDWGHDVLIAPHSVRVQQGTYVLDRAALISSFRPHMHMRGREQTPFESEEEILEDDE